MEGDRRMTCDLAGLRRLLITVALITPPEMGSIAT